MRNYYVRDRWYFEPIHLAFRSLCVAVAVLVHLQLLASIALWCLIVVCLGVVVLLRPFVTVRVSVGRVVTPDALNTCAFVTFVLPVVASFCAVAVAFGWIPENAQVAVGDSLLILCALLVVSLMVLMWRLDAMWRRDFVRGSHMGEPREIETRRGPRPATH